MLGPIIIVALVVLVIPPSVLIMGMVFSALLGWLATGWAEDTHEDSELIDLNT